MNFTVREWMMDLVVYVEPEAGLMEALALMRRRYIQSLIVRKSETCKDYGILTTTDISDKIIALYRNPADVKVKDVMTSPLITVMQNDSLVECAKKMKANHIHHLPVVNENEEIVGMISATDFLVAAEAYGSKPGEKMM